MLRMLLVWSCFTSNEFFSTVPRLNFNMRVICIISTRDSEPEIILKFGRNTIPIDIKDDRKISNLIGFFCFVLYPRWLNLMKILLPNANFKLTRLLL